MSRELGGEVKEDFSLATRPFSPKLPSAPRDIYENINNVPPAKPPRARLLSPPTPFDLLSEGSAGVRMGSPPPLRRSGPAIVPLKGGSEERILDLRSRKVNFSPGVKEYLIPSKTDQENQLGTSKDTQ